MLRQPERKLRMKLAIAGDSAGAVLAKVLADHLKDRHEVSEISRIEGVADSFYATLSDRVAADVIAEKYDRAILVCGTGIGVCIAANKVPGIRAALTHDTYSAERAALSNNAQIITMGARVIGPELAKTIADAWLAQTMNFDDAGKSAGNVAAVDAIDAKYNR
jgi:RpiB/LacA/LacB family sugar-phosphate isomerase